MTVDNAGWRWESLICSCASARPASRAALWTNPRDSRHSSRRNLSWEMAAKGGDGDPGPVQSKDPEGDPRLSVDLLMGQLGLSIGAADTATRRLSVNDHECSGSASCAFCTPIDQSSRSCPCRCCSALSTRREMWCLVRRTGSHRRRWFARTVFACGTRR